MTRARSWCTGRSRRSTVRTPPSPSASSRTSSATREEAVKAVNKASRKAPEDLELRGFAREAAGAWAEAENLRWRLAMSGRRIAHGEARKLAGPFMDEEDLVQEGRQRIDNLVEEGRRSISELVENSRRNNLIQESKRNRRQYNKYTEGNEWTVVSPQRETRLSSPRESQLGLSGYIRPGGGIFPVPRKEHEVIYFENEGQGSLFHSPLYEDSVIQVDGHIGYHESSISR